MKNIIEFSSIFSPVVLFFLIILLGSFIGRIKAFNISLDISAVLILSIIVGFCLSKISPAFITNEFNNGLSFISKVGTSVFISVIGITSGFSITKNTTKNGCFSFLGGAFMVLAGFITAKLILCFDKGMDYSLLMGIFCGSMTSTPALAALCENTNVSKELASLGYGVAYLFGVIGIVLFVQLFSKKEVKNELHNKEKLKKVKNSLDPLFLISFVSVTGNIIGSFKIPIINISLGATGGVLLSGVVFGKIIRHVCINRDLSKSSMNIYRNLGLIMFFIGNGILAGEKLNTNLQIKWFLYGAIITILSILMFCILCWIRNKKICNSDMYIIAGGMTSTPALGALLRRFFNKRLLEYYSFSYLGALAAIVILMKYVV